MWNQIRNNDELMQFMDLMCYFHDSCIKEMCYISGAYVNDDLSMNPVNDRRVLKVVIQRQFEENSMIEMEFSGLKKLKLCPVDEEFTCEILGSTMYFKEGLVYWFDCDDSPETNSDIIICAEQVRWRPVKNCMGKAEFYKTD